MSLTASDLLGSPWAAVVGQAELGSMRWMVPGASRNAAGFRGNALRVSLVQETEKKAFLPQIFAPCFSFSGDSYPSLA